MPLFACMVPPPAGCMVCWEFVLMLQESSTDQVFSSGPLLVYVALSTQMCTPLCFCLDLIVLSPGTKGYFSFSKEIEVQMKILSKVKQKTNLP